MGGGGNILVLMQPFEILIVCGSAFGVFMISNPKRLRKQIAKHMKQAFVSRASSHEEYKEMLVFMFYFLRFIKSSTPMIIEKHIESPRSSNFFAHFSRIQQKDHVLTFVCDYIRLIIMGCENPYEIERMIDEDLQSRYHEIHESAYALHRIADALPALGIIGAVLGVINAMSALNAEPAVLAHKIAAALIGTFLGVFLSYCIISPLCFSMEKYAKDEMRFLESIKSAILTFARGQPPIISVESARQAMPTDLKPSFVELERAIRKYKKPQFGGLYEK